MTKHKGNQKDINEEINYDIFSLERLSGNEQKLMQMINTEAEFSVNEDKYPVSATERDQLTMDELNYCESKFNSSKIKDSTEKLEFSENIYVPEDIIKKTPEEPKITISEVQKRKWLDTVEKPLESKAEAETKRKKDLNQNLSI